MTCPSLRLILPSLALFALITSNHVAESCLYIIPSKQTTIPVRLSADQQTEIQVTYVEADNDLRLEESCSAWVEVPLSAFPTARLASRPFDFAPAIRETMEEWSVDECEIRVWFMDDVGDEMTQAESCVIESFEFEKGRYWSTSSEESCFEEIEA